MAKSRQSEETREAARRHGFAKIEEVGDDGLRVRTLWNPFPAWLVPIGFSTLVAVITAIIVLAAGGDGDDITSVIPFPLIGAYVAGAIIWAVLGAVGGDRLEILFDGETETATVDQRILWRWGRTWTFELDDVERVYVWSKRGRLIFRLNETFYSAIGFYDRPPLSISTFHTDGEVMAASMPIASFVGVPLRRNEKPPEVGDRDPA